MVIPSPGMRDETVRSQVGPLVGRVLGYFCLNRPEWHRQTPLGSVSTRQAPGKEQAGSVCFVQFSSRFTPVLDNQGTLLGGGSGRLVPDLSG
ncbi:hypothetical protein CDL15_Pgr009143 [Punica granatum]|uniref:Uncharacterized protein n=1 Tax=Punica granatum TaxID=22663 RepID=A0A218WJ63_PUNGR|nr:hypothetical protein CDL15_Pgr009143 [Punica granatum]